VALCTRYLGTTFGPEVAAPSVVLFDPVTAQPVASLELRKDGLLGGVYGFLDDRNRVVVAEGQSVVKVEHVVDNGRPVLRIAERIPLGPESTDVSVAGLTPDGAGRVWFATEDSRIGYLTASGQPYVLDLGVSTPGGEKIANGLTPRPDGVSVLTTHALYEVGVAADGSPEIRWSRSYDRGSARKPGQLSQGSGTTPTFFGPDSSRVAIVDNADERPNLLVYDAATGETVCSVPAFGTSGQGTENSLPARGSSLWIPSTYGYSYPSAAVDGESRPASATFTGGLTRVDLETDPEGREHCVRKWETGSRLETLPELTVEDGRIWALSRDGDGPVVSLLGVDVETGEEVTRTPVGVLPFDEPMQLTGMIAPDGTLWQGTATRMLKVAPAR